MTPATETTSTTSSTHEVADLPLSLLMPDPMQPRQTFSERHVRELADSIERHGLLQPLLVRPALEAGSEGKYWIVAGERRFRAAHLLGMPTLPCRIRPYQNTAAAVIALADNVHRADLTDIEKADALLQIKTLTDRTWDEVAELVRLSRDYVKRLAGLLKLEEPVKQMLQAGQISARVAIALKPLPPKRQLELAEAVIREGLTAEQVRERSGKVLPRQRRTPKAELAAPLSPAFGGERDGPVVGSLRECAAAVDRMETWLEGRSWAPAKVSDRQRKALDDLYERVSRLQQELIAIRQPLRETEETEAESLRKANPLPF